MAELAKVTAFVTRPSPRGRELLLFEHPYAGVQIPAGTVEPGETPRQAALRETAEETGLAEVTLLAGLGTRDAPPPEGYRFLLQDTTLYARPDPTSFDWTRLPRATMVHVLRQEPGFTQVEYTEWDQWPDRNMVSMHILGWAPDDALTRRQQRHFFHLTPARPTPARWTVFTDHHYFSLFWAPLDALPGIVSPQDRWIEVLLNHLGDPPEGENHV